MHTTGFASIILIFAIILGLMGLPPITRNLPRSILSSSHLSAFAQKPPIQTGQEQHLSAFAETPFSTNRVTAGQQQSSFAHGQGPTSSFLPLSNQSAIVQTPSTTTAGDGGSSQNQSGSKTTTTTNNALSNTNNTTK